MSRRKIYPLVILAALAIYTWTVFDSNENQEDFSEHVKVSLRDVGHQLLLSNQDSTSLVLPVVELNRSKYELSFETPVSFEPGTIVSAVRKSFEKAELPEHYRVEVIRCEDEGVAHSYEVNVEEEKTIIPCATRALPENCYTIQVRFIKQPTPFLAKRSLLYFLLGLAGVFLLFEFLFFRRKKAAKAEEQKGTYASLGSFRFYPEQNKLVKEAVEIGLSKKECELLAIFIASPNQIIKRDELTKKVWEDNGVIVGRSLDTYISKLRKKLQDDDAIKLTNVHGVGYKLEIL